MHKQNVEPKSIYSGPYMIYLVVIYG